jgi:hypothetical protein
VESDIDLSVSQFRNRAAQALEPYATRVGYQDPGPETSVPAAQFLHHVTLDRPEILRVLRLAYPYLTRNKALKADVLARLKFVVWAILVGETKLASAHRRLLHDSNTWALLGFREPPAYDTLREFVNERLLLGNLLPLLLDVLVTEEKRLFPDLGNHQVQDATPVEARRREENAPYNPHYGIRMMKLELRWDPRYDALLTQQFYGGLNHESGTLPVLSARLHALGIRGEILVTDTGYAGFENTGRQWRTGEPLTYRRLDEWRIDTTEAEADVRRRYQRHHAHPLFIIAATLDAQIRFLLDHGTEPDIEAAGRLIRDRALTQRTPEQQATLDAYRSKNEALNGELKRLPLLPWRRGIRELWRRSMLCCLALHVVQLNRLQHGLRAALCRTAFIL